MLARGPHGAPGTLAHSGADRAAVVRRSTVLDRKMRALAGPSAAASHRRAAELRATLAAGELYFIGTEHAPVPNKTVPDHLIRQAVRLQACTRRSAASAVDQSL